MLDANDAAPIGGETMDVTVPDTPASSGEGVDAQTGEAGQVNSADSDPNEGWNLTDDEIASFRSKPAEATASAEEGETTVEEVQSTENPEKAEETGEETEEKTNLLADEEIENSKGLENLRAAYKTVKQSLLDLQKNSLERKFLVDTKGLLTDLQTKSPSRYAELVREAAQISAESNPDGWAKYLSDVNPDLLVQTLFNDPKLTLNRLRAERDYVAENETSLFDTWEENADEKPALAPEEQSELEKLRLEKQEKERVEKASAVQELYGKVAQPIYEAVDRLCKDNGLEVSPNDTQEETEFKTLINTILPEYISMRISQDEEFSTLYSETNKLIQNLDENGALAMQMALVDFAETEAEKFIATIVGKRKREAETKTLPRTSVPPPKVVTPNGSLNSGVPKKLPDAKSNVKPFDINEPWTVTDDDLKGIGVLK